ncbi:MAG: 4-alpha-glucanotransferase [Bacteroidetes bacterium 4572_77]|nr:MAG: 4-alpha-glucanotransferase [Bacteroidetes bacterium 4572_77]
MKVLMFGWEFPPHITGGLGTASYGLTKGLVKHDIEVLFVVPKAYGDEDQRAVRLVNASDIPVNYKSKEIQEFWNKLTYLEIGSNIMPYIDPEDFENLYEDNAKTLKEKEHLILGEKYNFTGKYGKNLMEEVARYALVGASIAQKYDFDIIHAHDWLTYSAGIAAQQVSGKPLVVHMHATEYDRSGEGRVNTEVFALEKAGMQHADLVIPVSNLTRNTVINKYDIPAEKVITVHNAIEPVELQEMDVQKSVKEKVVTFLGRLTFQKGPEYFVEAAKRILDKDPNVRFVMAGNGDMMNQLIRRVAELKIAHKFHFTGFLKGEEVDHMFRLSDVFVMPSVSEPFGLVPLEAMRSDVPVVISKQSGVAEVLKNALKVDFWDVEGMADAIYGLLHYPALSNMFIKNGKEEVDNLKWEHAAEKIKILYQETLNQYLK